MAVIERGKILDLISTNNEQLYIPIYQRNYEWNEENVTKLILDIWRFKNEVLPKDEEAVYYIGNIIQKNIEDDGEITRKKSIVDGQQRITTFLLIIKALHSIDNRIPINDFIYANSREDNKMRISRAKANDALIKILVEDVKNLDANTRSTRYFENYKTALKVIEEYKIEPIIFYNTLRSVAVAHISLKKYEDESQVFETVNSTGKSLESPDLIKNYLLSKVHEMKIKDQNELESIYSNRIEDILDMIKVRGSKKSGPEAFFRYFTAIEGNLPLAKSKGHKVYFDFKEMIKRKEINISNFDDVKEILLKIQKIALIYNRSLEPNTKIIKTINDSKMRLFEEILSVNTVYFPMYYSLIDKYTYMDNNQLAFNKDAPHSIELEILQLIAKYYLYRRIASKKDKNITRDVPKYVKQYEDELEDKNEFSIAGFEEALRNRKSDDQRLSSVSDVAENLEDVSYNDVSLVKFILLAAEVAAPKTNPFSSFDVKLNIEHILPQTHDLWFDEAEEKGNIREFMQFARNKHKLGNLTIVTHSMNSSVSNSLFLNKKVEIIKDHQLAVNTILDKYNSYNESLINERLNFIAKNLFRLFNEKIAETITLKDEMKQNIININLAQKYNKTDNKKTTLELNSNFNWVKDPLTKEMMRKIEKYAGSDETSDEAYTIARKVLENAIAKKLGYKQSLYDGIVSLSKEINSDMIDVLHDIRRKGNNEVHNLGKIKKSKTQVIYVLEGMFKVLSFLENYNDGIFKSNIYYENKNHKYHYKIDDHKIENQKTNHVRKKTERGNNLLSDITSNLNVIDNIKRIDYDDILFDYVHKNESNSNYEKDSIPGFNKENSKLALYKYLYEGLAGYKVDDFVTNGIRRYGWLTAATLAYFGIETKGASKGALKMRSPEEAKKIIDSFVDNNY